MSEADKERANGDNAVTEAQIKYMADRFLSWNLPESFHPDGGISFQRSSWEGVPRPMPYGTNLFDVGQAQAMVRYMADGVMSVSPSGLKDQLVSKIDQALHDAEDLDMPAQVKSLVSQAHADLHDLAGLLSDDAEIRASTSATLVVDQPQHQGEAKAKP